MAVTNLVKDQQNDDAKQGMPSETKSDPVQNPHKRRGVKRSSKLRVSSESPKEKFAKLLDRKAKELNEKQKTAQGADMNAIKTRPSQKPKQCQPAHSNEEKHKSKVRATAKRTSRPPPQTKISSQKTAATAIKENQRAVPKEQNRPQPPTDDVIEAATWYEGCVFACPLCHRRRTRSFASMCHHIQFDHAIQTKKKIDPEALAAEKAYFDCALCKKSLLREKATVAGHLLQEHKLSLEKYDGMVNEEKKEEKLPFRCLMCSEVMDRDKGGEHLKQKHKVTMKSYLENFLNSFLCEERA